MRLFSRSFWRSDECSFQPNLLILALTFGMKMYFFLFYNLQLRSISRWEYIRYYVKLETNTNSLLRQIFFIRQYATKWTKWCPSPTVVNVISLFFQNLRCRQSYTSIKRWLFTHKWLICLSLNWKVLFNQLTPLFLKFNSLQLSRDESNPVPSSTDSFSYNPD